MRAFSAEIFIIQIVILSMCAVKVRHSMRPIARSVSLLLFMLIPPVAGNLIITLSTSRLLSLCGCYVYFLGMDLVIYALYLYTLDYCHITPEHPTRLTVIRLFLLIDGLQLLANLIFHHAFGMEWVLVENASYYRVIPYLGQAFHRVVVYGVFLLVLLIFFQKLLTSPRVSLEKYAVIFITMVVTGLIESYFIFSRQPIDLSMIAFGMFGILVFYFSMYYKPYRLLDQMLVNFVQDMSLSVFFFDHQGRCVWANNLGLRLTGLDEETVEQAKGRLKELFGSFEQPAEDCCTRMRFGTGESAKYFSLTKETVRDKQHRLLGSFLTIRDETAEQLELSMEKYKAAHDELTGLYTKSHLYQRVRETIDANPGTTYLAVFLNVKDFKMINDVYGNAFGDRVLIEIANSLRATMPEGCLYGRISGDTFGMLIPQPLFDAEIATRSLSDFTVRNGSFEHRTLMHEGVYEIKNPKLEVSVMFDRAHLAQETIRNEYKQFIAFYDERMRQTLIWNRRISAQLSRALSERQICPYLQPIFDGGGAVIGAEALVRWNNPEEGFLSPDMFVPLLEQNGMIADMDRYMWRCACEILAAWQKAGYKDLFLSVNVSPKDFYFMDVSSEMKELVREYGIPPGRLRVEITESVMMTDNQNRIRIMKELREAGFLVEMDDFGSGYSSLNMLKDMPIDLVKIDMLFLKEAGLNRKAQTILRNIMHMTGELSIPALTEGVETEEQFHMLLEMGCSMFQGYYFAKPMPLEQFEAFCFSDRGSPEWPAPAE